MKARVALIGIIVENIESVSQINLLLHEYGSFICGRMGVPHMKKKMNIISVVLDAPEEAINDLSTKLGMLPGITCRVICADR